MILLHGSNTVIDKIDLGKCRPHKDFGQGFYTTPFEEQALAMARRTARIYGGKPFITIFEADDSLLSKNTLSVRVFKEPNIDWAHFVMNNRNRNFSDTSNSECNSDNKYDIIAGPVANDDLVALLDLYIAGTISNAVLISEMTYRKLTNQISFHTEKALACIRKTGLQNG